MLHWLAVAIRTYLLHPLRGNGYQLWSGAGADLSELTLIGVAIGAYRRVNCHAPRCLRLGRHPTADGHRLCAKHHPDMPNRRLSLDEIHDRHRTHEHHRHDRP